MEHAFEGFFGLGTISWGLKLETCFLLEFPAWSGDVMTSFPQKKWWGPGSVSKPENFGKTSPTKKTHPPKRDDVFDFFFFFGEVVVFGTSPKSSMS